MGAMIVVMLLMLAIILVFMFVPGITFQVIEASFNKIKTIVTPNTDSASSLAASPTTPLVTGGKRKRRK
jgi:uncharacterized membrane protein YjgN (DUF898 family)